jgi:hypothetical protein
VVGVWFINWMHGRPHHGVMPLAGLF